jgi:hypothetical protein
MTSQGRACRGRYRNARASAACLRRVIARQNIYNYTRRDRKHCCDQHEYQRPFLRLATFGHLESSDIIIAQAAQPRSVALPGMS